MLSARSNPDEFTQFSSFKKNEKMIVNLLKCLIQAGHPALRQAAKQSLLSACLYLEQDFKFKSKAMIYLLKIFDPNVEKMLKNKKNEIAVDKMRKKEKEK